MFWSAISRPVSACDFYFIPSQFFMFFLSFFCFSVLLLYPCFIFFLSPFLLSSPNVLLPPPIPPPPPTVSLVKFADGDWILDEPQFVLATFLDVTALECQLPLEDSRTPAGLDVETATSRPLARWQIKVSPVSVPSL